MVEGLQLREVLARYAALEPDRAVQKHYLTAYMAAAASSEHTFSKEYTAYDVQVLAHGEAAAGGMLNLHLVDRSLQLRAWDQQHDGTLQLLAHRLREFLLGDQLGYGREYRNHVKKHGLPRIPANVIRVHTSAVLVAEVPWSAEHSVLQTVRAHSSFHGSPFYDNIAVRMNEEAAPVLEYAQLLLLFEAQLPDRQTGELAWTPLAYVKWFNKESSRGDIIAAYGGQPLSWDVVDYDPATKSRGNRCSIVHLSSIYSRQYIVPEFSEGTSEPSGRYYVNPFKY